MTTIQIILIVLGVIGLLMLFKWQTSAFRDRQKELEKLVAERTAALEAQIEEAERQKEIAKLSERYKEQFLANMSHEIRTPMNAISGITNILKRNPHPPEQDQYLEAISQSAGNLLIILNDILDLSKIEAGKIKIDSVQMNPRNVIEVVTEILKISAEQRGLFFKSKVDGSVPTFVMGDPVRLNQILVNLASNGIKFTEQGGITMFVRKVTVQGTDMLQYSIQDTGIGIVDDKQGSIFGEYEQVDDEHGKQYAGTGLGLSVSKQLVELQNGQIWLESKTGEGSTFFFTLPLITVLEESQPEKYLSEEELKSMSRSLRGLNILLAEDNEFNILVVNDDLTHFIPEVSVEVVKSGDQALHRFLDGNYDMILMDIQMPLMNGYDATKEIRKWESKNKGGKPIPIVAMTASLLQSEIKKGFEAGMNNFVPKPYKIDELLGAIFTEAQNAGYTPNDS